jgi:hypothetical protein
MGIRTPVFGVKGRNDWPDYTIAANCPLMLILNVKIIMELITLRVKLESLHFR